MCKRIIIVRLRNAADMGIVISIIFIPDKLLNNYSHPLFFNFVMDSLKIPFRLI